MTAFRHASQPVVPDASSLALSRGDLSGAYGDAKFNRASVRGLIHIFEDYGSPSGKTPSEDVAWTDCLARL